MGKSFQSVEDMAKAAPQTRRDPQTRTEQHSRTILVEVRKSNGSEYWTAYAQCWQP